jgi:signal transduction histidine kinase
MIGTVHFDRPILVVDDTNATRYSTCRVLSAAGATLLEAVTGNEALRLAPDCSAVLLDIRLPDIDGFTVCRMLRADPATAHLPVIHLSAQYLRDADKAHGLDIGADAYLTHPVDPAVLVSTINAVHRMRTAERREARSRARIEAIFRTAPVGIVLIADDGPVLTCNEEFTRMFGIDCAATSLQDMPEPVRHAHARSRGEAHGADRWSTTLASPSASGEPLRVEWHVSRVGGDSSLIVVVDDSDRYAMEVERADLLERERSARAEAEDANRTKDTFLALLSHELRNPLNTVGMWASVLRRPEALSRLSEGLDAITRSVALQSKLVGDLLDVARLSTGKLELTLEPVAPAPIVRDVVMAVEELRAEKQIALIVSADAPRLHQMIWNLVTNAIKFSRPLGSVTLTLAAQQGDMVLRVTDQGAGIAPDFLPLVFDRFRQSNDTRSHRRGGLGLGLSVVKSLAEMHRGSVDATSEGLNRGASFVLRLPLQGERAQHHASLQTPLRGRSILVVEDSEESRRMFALLLEQYGAHVLQCESAENALAVLEAHSPALILSDIGLPGMDGLQFIRTLRASGSPRADIPAIAVTAFARSVDVERALAAGFQRHLAKPVDAGDLLNAVLSTWSGTT